MPNPEREAYLLGYNAAKKGAKLTDPVPAHVHSAMNERYSVRRSLVQGFKDGAKMRKASQELQAAAATPFVTHFTVHENGDITQNAPLPTVQDWANIKRTRMQTIRNGAIVSERVYDLDEQADVFRLATTEHPALFSTYSARKKLSQILAKGFDETADKEVS